MLRLAALLLLATLSRAGWHPQVRGIETVPFRFQREWVDDKWSAVHMAGGAICYAALRKTEHPFWLSLGVATLWEVGDGFKPNRSIYGDWRDHVLTGDGFSYSDIVYHMAGTYSAWLVDLALQDRAVVACNIGRDRWTLCCFLPLP